MTSTAAETVGARLAGTRTSRGKALLVSFLAGGAASVLTYRWLRAERD